jgi:uncharacterized protein YndB with AHSA1/START domain
MNTDHALTLTLDASPEAVFPEIASLDGLRRWWSAGADGSDQVNGIVRITFRENHWTEMRIEKLDPGRKVRWESVAQHEPGFERPDEWVGTSVSFRLDPAPANTTTLHFAHHGLPALDCFQTCRRGWDFQRRRQSASPHQDRTGQARHTISSPHHGLTLILAGGRPRARPPIDTPKAPADRHVPRTARHRGSTCRCSRRAPSKSAPCPRLARKEQAAARDAEGEMSIAGWSVRGLRAAVGDEH